MVFLDAIGEGRESGRFVSLTGAERTVSYAVPRDREELHDRIATGELKYVIPNTGIKMVKPAHLRENMDPRAVRVAHMIDFDGGDAATGCFICGRCEDASYCYLCQLHWHSFVWIMSTSKLRTRALSNCKAIRAATKAELVSQICSPVCRRGAKVACVLGARRG